ncbi:CPBP family intramembrane glutamic endopeptidase [Bacillus cereus]|uniref:CPBP family intramembrane glutamic endopeptidase n=1 Tax=Bacillus cereus TaxID=1396 RepID=UPI00187A58F4|nr:CPBP family intramembrane glutamic endopeptidase [Bacillus cereus]MBE7123128.1 CPBP family intramembrane metalloprotease [Bacillus cereus]
MIIYKSKDKLEFRISGVNRFFILAAAISSFLFAAMHFNFDHVLVYMSMGFVFSFLYVKTYRIAVPITAHALMNCLPLLSLFNS